MTILDRYLVRGLVNTWLVGLTVFVGFLTAGEVLTRWVELVFMLGAPMTEALRWFLLAFPKLIALSIPMATLLAVVMLIGRMSHDLEITALSAAGISFYRLLTPIGLFAFGVGLLSFWLNAFVVPPTYGAADALLWQFRGQRGKVIVTDLFLREPPKGPPKLMLLAMKFLPPKGEMEGVELFHWMPDGKLLYLQAEKAIWQGKGWEFHQGFWQVISPEGIEPKNHFVHLKNLPVRVTSLNLPKDINRDPKRNAPNRLSLPALTREIRKLQNWGAPQRIINEYRVEWHNRFALALSCFALAMLGAPIALKLRRGGGVSVGVSVVFVLLYYVVWNIGNKLGISGSLPPFLGSHLANLLGAIGAIGLLLKLR